ncbi:putative prophage phiRv2 integrase [Nostocoides japonicum T1-X7]|uniref:Putative prophage phiRv2 integrase n=1 Tax=Nostocoides japonicum T1-X7 TaxID=1194083 RepID=A0A077M0L7_9MICO|nr:site-specific integrase [Tetrasphaera japonica]CCH77729.1 putative prophage phiRv2 integrase [Tetrasphaera japonica T1-X7]
MAGTKGRRGFGRTRKLPSGRWQAFYGDPDGRTEVSRGGKATPVRHTAGHTFDTREDAEAWLTDERRLISEGRWTPPTTRKAQRRAKRLTFGEYAEAWLAGRKIKGRPLADRTRDHYRDLLDHHILPTFKDVALADITPEMVDRWYELCAIGRPTTQAHAYGLLRTVLATAVDRRIITTANPAKVRGGGSTKRAKNTRPATLEELGVIVAAMPERRRLMITLAAWCALRFGELAELRREDVSTKTGIIHIRRGVVRVRQEDEDGTRHMVRKVKTPKSEAGVRDVPIPPHLLGDVRDHLLTHTAPGREGLLFPGQGGGHLSTSAFYGRVSTLDADGKVVRRGHGWYEARRLAGREDLRFHDLRHTGLTNAAVVGATLAELMRLAGHSTASAAMRYQHAAQDRMKDLAARLSQMAEEAK